MYQIECLTKKYARVYKSACAPWIGGCYPDDGHCGPECNPANECAPDFECRPDNCRPQDR
ncbi:MAG TPA: hypothetical protein DCQ46_02445 [Lachnospiraceae bacterium]|nr:hypothetical protein [Lachnospiraceae bacterium]